MYKLYFGPLFITQGVRTGYYNYCDALSNYVNITKQPGQDKF